MNERPQEMLEQAQTLARLWMDALSRMTGAAFAFTPGSTPPEAARQIRDAFLSSLGHSLESYMRSEPFLRSMKQSLDTSVEMRRQFSQVMTQAQHSVGMVAVEDIRSLMLGIRHTEERLANRMEQVLSRLERIETRLQALESNGNGSEVPRAAAGETGSAKEGGQGSPKPAGKPEAPGPARRRGSASRKGGRKS